MTLLVRAAEQHLGSAALAQEAAPTTLPGTGYRPHEVAKHMDKVTRTPVLLHQYVFTFEMADPTGRYSVRMTSLALGAGE